MKNEKKKDRKAGTYVPRRGRKSKTMVMRKLVGATNFPNETVTGLLRYVFGVNNTNE